MSDDGLGRFAEPVPETCYAVQSQASIQGLLAATGGSALPTNSSPSLASGDRMFSGLMSL